MTDNDFIRKYAKLVYTLALSRTNQKSDADDVFQEVFLRYIDKGPTFRDEQHERAWLIRVTVNLTKNLYRSSEFTRRADCQEDELEALPSKTDDISEAEDKVVFEQNLERVGEKYRAALLLYYDCGYKMKEIAKILGVSERRIKALLERGKREYRQIILEGDVMNEYQQEQAL